MKFLKEFTKFDKELKYLIYAGFFPSLAYGIFFIDAAYFLTNIRGFSDTFMGFLYTLMGLSLLIFSIPAGILSDRFGKKKILLTGNIIASLSIIIFAITNNTIMLIMSSFLLGISEGMIGSSSSALLAEKSGDKRRTLAFSFSGFINGISFGLGGFAISLSLMLEGMGMNEIAAHEFLYIIFSLLALSSSILILKVSESPIFKREKSLKSLLTYKTRGVVIKYTIANSLIGFGAGIFVPLMTRWFYLMYNITDTISGPIIGFTNLLIGFSNLFAPFLVWRIGLINSIVLSQSFSILFLFLLPFSPTFFIASILFFIRSFLMNITVPIQQAMIMSLVDEKERGTVSGINSLAWYLPYSMSISLGAWLLEIGKLSIPFFIATALYATSTTFFWLFFKNVKEHRGIITTERMIS